MAPFSTAARAAQRPDSADPMMRMSQSLVWAMSVIASEGVMKEGLPPVDAAEDSGASAAGLEDVLGEHPASPAAATAAPADTPKKARRERFFEVMLFPSLVLDVSAVAASGPFAARFRIEE